MKFPRSRKWYDPPSWVSGEREVGLGRGSRREGGSGSMETLDAETVAMMKGQDRRESLMLFPD